LDILENGFIVLFSSVFKSGCSLKKKKLEVQIQYENAPKVYLHQIHSAPAFWKDYFEIILMTSERDLGSRTITWQDFCCKKSSSKETPENNFLVKDQNFKGVV
jgi:hypothetical protein